MPQIFHLDPDARAWSRRYGSDSEEADDGFWPEVCSDDALQNPPPDPENAQGRVLSEVFLILAAAAALVAAVMLFLPEAAFTQ